ncbi:MAG: OadG family protein [Ignavibacteriae bacterium]|nr:OadG family protein [Ignavibacteriota bacterium]
MELIFESLLLLVVGMSGVFASLLLLAGMIWLFRFADETLNKRRIQTYSKKVELHEVVDEVNDEVVAVITAAVTAALRKPVVVRRVQFLNQKSGSASWAVTGRVNIMASHAIAKRKS